MMKLRHLPMFGLPSSFYVTTTESQQQNTRVEITSRSMRVIRGRGKRERSPEGVRGKLQEGMMRRRRRWPRICARKNKNWDEAEGGRRKSQPRPRPPPRSMTSFPAAMLSPPSRTSAQASSPSRCASLICNSSSDCPHWRSELRCGASCISLRFNTLE